MQKQKVCIIGAGLTGLITAVCLSKLNLEIDLVADNMNQNLQSFRTTAISESNYSFLSTISSWLSINLTKILAPRINESSLISK